MKSAFSENVSGCVGASAAALLAAAPTHSASAHANELTAHPRFRDQVGETLLPSEGRKALGSTRVLADRQSWTRTPLRPVTHTKKRPTDPSFLSGPEMFLKGLKLVLFHVDGLNKMFMRRKEQNSCSCWTLKSPASVLIEFL